jgi:hypothetical protein
MVHCSGGAGDPCPDRPEFRFTIEPQRDLSCPNADGRQVLDEGGMIVLMAGPHESKFRLKN